jgi:purine-binding chemotaxis protein CheW
MGEPQHGERGSSPNQALRPQDAAGATADGPEPAGIVRQAVRIGGLRLLFDFASTSRLSELVPITPLPATPHWLRGLSSLHGMVLPVFDLAALMGLDRSAHQRSLLLVVGHGEAAAAIVIEGLPDRFRFEDAERASVWDAPEWLSECVSAAYARSGETWLDVDHQRLLAKIEQRLATPG